MTPAQQIAALRAALHRHNHLYYIEHTPEITDYEFDTKLKELEQLEQQHPELFDPNSPTQRVGADHDNKFKQVPHIRPMLSLGNTYNLEELSDFDNRIRKQLANQVYQYVSELKFDGISISLHYDQGKLQQALTRGDGTQGDDVTQNIRTINTIPLTVPKLDKFEVRGEIIMRRKTFDFLNQQRIEKGEAPFANPRNATAGSVKLIQPKEVAKRKLECFAYSYLEDETEISHHSDSLELLKELGFNVFYDSRTCQNLEDLTRYIEYWDSKRKEINFEIDGIVIKVNDYKQQHTLGFTAKSPRWAISYKFKAESVSTQLKAVSYQVGRTGAITPVAELAPIQLSGTVVKRASLHNESIIQNLGIQVNDYVFVEKGGEIIPKVTGIDKSQNSPEPKKLILFPNTCPACQSPLIKQPEEAAHYCLNLNCPPQVRGKIEHFISRKAMNIVAGEATVKALYDKGFVKNIADLYQLSYVKVSSLEGFKEKSSHKLLDSIQESKSVPFERVLYALGIRHVGATVAKLLARTFKNIQNLQSATHEELIQVNEIGEVIARSLKTYFSQAEHQSMLEALQEAGLQFESQEQAPTGSALSGLNIVISGNFEGYSRNQIKDLIEQHGGKNTYSLSKNTSFLLAGDKIGPAKLKKAESLGIEIIDLQAFLEKTN